MVLFKGGRGEKLLMNLNLNVVLKLLALNYKKLQILQG